jgi:hypothetical protein
MVMWGIANSTISTPKKIWFHLSQWFQKGLIVKVYRRQQTPSCSNTSHDHYNLHRSCVPDLCHTTRWLFSGSVISWLSCFIGGVYWENRRPATSVTNFINNVVSSNKGILIADTCIVPFIPVVSERFNCESLQKTTDPKLQQYLTWPLQPSSEMCTWFVSHNKKNEKKKKKNYELMKFLIQTQPPITYIKNSFEIQRTMKMKKVEIKSTSWLQARYCFSLILK